MIIQSEISGGIPYLKFDYGNDSSDLIFMHANAYPPQCYIPLFEALGKKYNIICPLFRPLWKDSGNPDYIKDWTPLMNDMICFMESFNKGNNLVFGHSLGGHVALRIAIEHEHLINKAILLDPIIFPKWQILLWQNIQWTSLGKRLHPMIQMSKNQRLIYKGFNQMYNRYRAKNIFKRISDDNLKWLIKGLTEKQNNGRIKIKHPKDWELRIYQAGMISDKKIWKYIEKLNRDVLIFFAEFTRAPNKKVISRLVKKSNYLSSELIEKHTHLFPFERPKLIAEKIINWEKNA